MKQIKFSENLRTLRLSAKMTQKQLAKILGVDQRTVSAWEKGVCEPDFCCWRKFVKFSTNRSTIFSPNEKLFLNSRKN